MALFGKYFPAAGALLIAGTLGAQAAAKPTCDASVSKGALAKASFGIEQARGAQGTPAAATVLTSVVKQLEAAKAEDATIQALYLGQTLALWLSQPNEPLMAKRGSLGFVQNADVSINLAATIDSLFRVVETAKPGCTELTTAYRGGLPGYLSLVNGAIGALNADKIDSAETLAKGAQQLYSGSPYAAMVLGNVASKRKNDEQAVKYWAEAATTAAKDTIYRDVQRQVLGNAGAVFLTTASTATGAERVAAGRRAIDVYGQILAIPGTTGAYAAGTRQSLQSAQLLVGDTAAFVASYQPLLATPSAYSYQDLLNTAVNAARANKSADAARLFEATLSQNPYNRDALFNGAVVYLTLEQYEKVGPLVTRLVAVDPANPENYNLAARAYLARAKAAGTAKKVPLVAALNDTTMVWYNRGNAVPVEVTFNTFITGEKQVTLAGTVTDRRDKAAAAELEARNAKAGKASKPGKGKATAAAIAPAAVTLKIEALDKSGAVLGTQSVTTEPLAPGKTATFRTVIPASDAVAYRYTIGS